jgi:hypothetical protein
MKINIDEINPGVKKQGIGLQLFDSWFAYRQSLNFDTYESNIEISYNSAEPTDINILYVYMPDTTDIKIEKYDLVFLCNNSEPLQVCHPVMQELLKLDKVYLISNSYLTNNHKIKEKVIWYAMNIGICKDFWTRSFYPQYFENISNKKENLKTSSMIYINGEIRTNRQNFLNLLGNCIPIISNLKNNYVRKIYGNWESEEDLKFRRWVNYAYGTDIENSSSDQHHKNSVAIGVNEKFGKCFPGYFIMKEYFQNSCVIFPESNWQNDELSMTEKAIKCFFAGSLPWPIGGSNINSLYNEIGFSTAWNLLPDTLKKFDSVKDHSERHQLTVEAISWLSNNSHIFESDQYKQLVDQNRISFLAGDCDYKSVLLLDNIFQRLDKFKNTI